MKQITINDIAKRAKSKIPPFDWGISHTAVWRTLNNRRVPYDVFGGVRVYRLEDIEKIYELKEEHPSVQKEEGEESETP